MPIRFNTTRLLAISQVLLFLLAFPTLWRVAAAQGDSRAAEIEAARQEKAQHLQPDEPPKTERSLQAFKEKKILERITAGVGGFRLKLGGLVTGGGFAIGPEYLRQDLAGGNLTFRVAAQGSIKRYERFDLQFSAPHFARQRMFFDFFSVYHNYPGVNYYGPGPDSRKSSRSDYRFEDTSLETTLGVQPVRPLRFGVSSGYLFINVGPGTDTRFVSSERIFTPLAAPGIDRQSDFFTYGSFVEFDYRDNPGGPRSGGYYTVAYHFYSDQTLHQHDFRRLAVDLQQYIPLFNRRRVIMLRAETILTTPKGGRTVPFYLQPTLGGPNDLRGFRPFRFTDNKMILLNAEYRWEVFSGLDMALFTDAGKVYSPGVTWNLDRLQPSAGFGFRFNVQNNVFMRIDVGFSKEGPQVWLKFDNVFRRERIRSARFQ